MWLRCAGLESGRFNHNVCTNSILARVRELQLNISVRGHPCTIGHMLDGDAYGSEGKPFMALIEGLGEEDTSQSLLDYFRCE